MAKRKNAPVEAMFKTMQLLQKESNKRKKAGDSPMWLTEYKFRLSEKFGITPAQAHSVANFWFTYGSYTYGGNTKRAAKAFVVERMKALLSGRNV